MCHCEHCQHESQDALFCECWHDWPIKIKLSWCSATSSRVTHALTPLEYRGRIPGPRKRMPAEGKGVTGPTEMEGVSRIAGAFDQEPRGARHASSDRHLAWTCLRLELAVSFSKMFSLVTNIFRHGKNETRDASSKKSGLIFSGYYVLWLMIME